MAERDDDRRWLRLDGHVTFDVECFDRMGFHRMSRCGKAAVACSLSCASSCASTAET